MTIAEELYFDSDLRIAYIHKRDSESNAVVVCFSPFNTRSSENIDRQGQFLARSNYEVITVANLKDDWYQNIPPDALQAIQLKLTVINKRVILYGSSMGGYAASLFSSVFKANLVVAYSPQFSITDDYDSRWAGQAREILWRSHMASELVSPDCRYIYIFDPKNTDILHIRQYQSIIPSHQLRLVELPYSGHPTTTYLHEIGMLKHFALAVMRDDVSVADLMKKRRNSPKWLFEVAKSLYNRKRFVNALLFIDKAIELRSGDIAMMRLRVNLLVNLQRFEDALKQGEVIIQTGDSTFAKYFSWLKEKNAERESRTVTASN